MSLQSSRLQFGDQIVVDKRMRLPLEYQVSIRPENLGIHGE